MWHVLVVRQPALIFVWLLLGLLAGTAILFQWRNRSGAYDGRSLQEWVQVYRTMEEADGSAEARQARMAIHEIGARNLPQLIQRLGYDPAPRKRNIARLAHSLPGPIRHSGLMKSLLIDPGLVRANTAATALEVLGPDARPAVGNLTRLMENTNSTLVSRRAIWTLAHMESAGVLPLQLLITNSHHPNRLFAVDCLGLIGTNALPAVPTLVQLAEDPNPTVRQKATNALCQIIGPGPVNPSSPYSAEK